MKEITPAEREQLKTFFDACNEMINGRFILSDIKVTNILKAIAGSEILYNLFAKCLNGFKFAEEFSAAQTTSKINGGFFVLPAEKYRVVALVFCLLLEVDNKRINLQQFVNDYFFSADGYNISYSNFAVNVLVPFKNAVLETLDCFEDGTPNPDEQEADVQAFTKEEKAKPDNKTKITFVNLKREFHDLQAAVNRDFKIRSSEKEELNIVFNGLYEAIELENFKIINALMIPLEMYLGKNKNVRSYYDDVKESLVKFYYQINKK